jgi:hypothetical protein
MFNRSANARSETSAKSARHVAVFVEKGGDPRQIHCRAIINLERPVSLQEKVTLCVDRESQNQCRLCENWHIAD